jgi:flavodoxin
MSKNLIAYYTYSTNSVTKKAAEAIKEVVDGDLFEVVPVDAYPTDMQACIDQARKEIGEGFLPEVQSLPESLVDYDTIFVGAPNWCSTIAPPIATFLAKQEFTGKKVVLFLTFGSSGLGNAQDDVIKYAKGATVLDPILIKAADVGTAKEIATQAIGKLAL